MAKKKQLKYCAYLLVFILGLAGCANQLPPTGGPKDVTPPEIIEIFPPSGITNFSEDYFEFDFSEYVDKRSVQDAIFITPKIDKLDYNWSGRTLTIEFDDTLKENTTYIVTIGTDIYDVNNHNNMAKAYTLAFSTGDQIDNGEVSGRVYDNNPAGVLIFAYKLDDGGLDSLNQEPDLISQVGALGNYKMIGLSEGKFRIYAVRDEYRDYIYNIGEDQYGSPFEDIELTRKDSSYSGMDFKLTQTDTSKPSLISAVMTDQYHFLIELSEFIDSTKISASNFYLVDSTAGRRFDFRYLFKGKAQNKKYFLALIDSLKSDNENYFIAENIFDKHKNLRNRETLQITVSDKPDTLAPEIAETRTQHNNKAIDLDDPFVIVAFNDGVDPVIAEGAFSFRDGKKSEIPIRSKLIDDGTFKLTIEGKLKSRSDYFLDIDMKRIVDAAGNSIDSVMTVKFETINELDFSGVSGKVVGGQNVKVVLENSGDSKFVYQGGVEAGEYKLEKIVPGKYLVWAFSDTDSNNIYSYGDYFPFIPAEKFIYFPDTLNLRARWPVGDVNLSFNK